MTTLQEMGEQPLTLDSLVLIMLKSADGSDQVAAFVALDNAPRDGDSTGVAEAAHSRRHPAPNAKPRTPPCLPLSPSDGRRRRSTSETSSSQYNT